MLARLLLLFTLVPLLELYVLVRFTQWTGNILLTLAIVIGTGVLGAGLARQQGWRVWWEIQRQLAAGKLPAVAVQEGLLILLAGALLITPGLLSDVAGLALLIPPLRQGVRRMLSARFAGRVTARATTTSWNNETNTYDTTFIETTTDQPRRHRVISARIVEADDESPRHD